MAHVFSIYTDTAGQIGINPRLVKIISYDNLATISAAGYLNPLTLEGYTILPTDEIHIWYNYQNATNPGIFAVFTANIVNGVVTLIPQVTAYTTSIVLNQAAIQNAYAVPFLLVPAPGAGQVLMVNSAYIYTNFQTSAFAGGGPAIVQYGNAIHGAGTDALSATIPAAEITAAASQVYALNGNTGNALTGISNQGLYFSNQTAAFTGGSAASTVVITLNYNLITASV